MPVRYASDSRRRIGQSKKVMSEDLLVVGGSIADRGARCEQKKPEL